MGVLFVIGAVFISRKLIGNKKTPMQKVDKVVKTVFTEIVSNDTIPIRIKNTGSLLAKDRVELFAEVQGVFEPIGKDFKIGVRFAKGENIISINNREHVASLKAQKSSLQNLITGLMSDLRLDYKEAFPKWDAYLKNFDIEQPLQALPEVGSDQERHFFSGRNVYTTYYNVKNLEERLAKYAIKAPFDGVLTDVSTTKGALIRAGQKLGEFIGTSKYELEVAVSSNNMNRMQIGDVVELTSLENDLQWEGEIIRVNGKVDQQTQSVKVYIEVAGNGLREGMYLEANLKAKDEIDAYEINRKLLVENSKVFALQDSTLQLIEIVPVYFDENTVVIKGLKDGTEILSKPVPGAYNGMLVKRFVEKK